jgi:hypothetical protein
VVGLVTVVFVVGWIVLAARGPLHSYDPYPFPFLLFLGNLVRLLLVFVILVGQGVLAGVLTGVPSVRSGIRRRSSGRSLGCTPISRSRTGFLTMASSWCVLKVIRGSSSMRSLCRRLSGRSSWVPVRLPTVHFQPPAADLHVRHSCKTASASRNVTWARWPPARPKTS